MTTEALPIHDDLTYADPSEINDRWEHAMSTMYTPASIRMDPVALRSGVNSLIRYGIDDLAVVDLECTPCTVTHSQRDADNGAEIVAVIFIQSGREHVGLNSDRATLSGGEVILWDPRDETTFSVPGRVTKRNLLLPRAELQAVLGRRVDLAALRPAGPCLDLLAGILPTLTRSHGDLRTSESRALRNAAIELVAGALGRDRGVPIGAHPQLRGQIDRWIDKHLAEELTPVRIAAEHAISVRTLNRLFSQHNETLSSYVRRRRLERAKDEVVRTGAALSEIAHRWGFSDGSHFTRSFTATFGSPPSALRRRSD